ncbi:D(2)-like dopamine receptor isoform X2 [Amphiura filiformis]|uniref:D(2)-like dopamine receptor isoform X2 n=1 Tax=Amphiura filiformis TaxID=82378 RepID=UPI003B21E5C6
MVLHTTSSITFSVQNSATGFQNVTPSTGDAFFSPAPHQISLVEKVIETFLLATIWFFAFFGNSLLWMVVFRSKALRTTSNALVLCLSSADVMVAVINLPVTLSTIILGEWKLGSRACTAFGFFNMLTFVGSVMSLGVISFNRYVLIVHQPRFRKVYTRKNTGFMIAGVWLFSGLLACPPLLGWGIYDYLPQQSFCFCDWTTSVSYTFFMVGVCFGGPCSVMTFCYVQILRVVRKSRQRVDTSMKRNSTSSRMPIPPVTLKVHPSEATNTNNTTKNNLHGDRNSTLSVTSSNCASSSSGQTDTTTVSDHMENTVLNNLKVPSKKHARNSKSFEQTNGQKSNDNDNHSKNSHQQDGHLLDRKISSEGSSNISNASELGGAANLQTNSKSTKEAYSNKGQSMVIEEDRPTFLNRLSHHGGSLMKSMVPTRTIRRRATENDRTRRRRQEELKLTKSFVVVIFCFIICWLPFCVAMFWNVFGKNPPPRIFDMSTLILGYFNSCCNPIIYGVMNNRFRAGYKAILCNLCSKNKASLNSLNSSAAGDQGSIINQTYSQNAHGSHE